MADLGATFTDAEIKAVEKELKAVYNKAYKELLQKQKEFNAKYAAKEAKKLKQLASGQITQEEFNTWKAGQIFQSKQWENKKKQILQTTYHTNEIAMGIVNGKISGIFAFNANYTAYQLEHGAGCNFGFGLYDEASVVNIIKNNPQLLPEWKIDQQKDYIWNQKKLNRQVTLGIVEGESLDKIATRLADSLSSQNFNKMRTFARTAMTGAQNAGRQIRLDEAKKLGINVKKEWMATLDAHTRMTHRKLDGQKVDTDKSFDINGMSIRFPGDPLAPAALVYNCRCTMVGDLVNYPATYDRYDNIDGKRIKGMTYSEWEEAKKKSGEQDHIVVNGKDLSTIWTRRPDQFDFEIEDVINAQGFDGLPRVVSAEEFERLSAENGIICKRGYAVNYETGKENPEDVLNRYHEELISGKWYVDCHAGSAAYGQGMYSYKKTGNINDTSVMDDAVKMYSGENGRVETFTFDKNAKIIKSDEIRALKEKENSLILERTQRIFESSGLSSTEEDIAKRMAGILPTWGKDGEKAFEIFENMTDEQREKIQNVVNKYNQRLRDVKNMYSKMDDGVFAALKGYDAIEANYDLGDNTKEFVILNRTKVVFKGE